MSGVDPPHTREPRRKRQCTLNVGSYSEDGSGPAIPNFRAKKRLLARHKDWIQVFKDVRIKGNQQLPTKQKVAYLYSQSFVTDLHEFLAVYDPTIDKDDVVKWVHDHKWIRDLTAEKPDPCPSPPKKRPMKNKRTSKTKDTKKLHLELEPISTTSQPVEDAEGLISNSETEDNDHDSSPSNGPMRQNQEERSEAIANTTPVLLPELQLKNGDDEDTFPTVNFDRKDIHHRGRKEFLFRSLQELDAGADNEKETDSGVDNSADSEAENERQAAIEEGRAIFNRMNAEATATFDENVEVVSLLSPSPAPPEIESSEETSDNTMSTSGATGSESSQPPADTNLTSSGGDDSGADADCDSPVNMTMAALIEKYPPKELPSNSDADAKNSDI